MERELNRTVNQEAAPKKGPVFVRGVIRILTKVVPILFIIYGRSSGYSSEEAKWRDAAMFLGMHQSDTDTNRFISNSVTDDSGHPLPSGDDGKTPSDSHSLDGVLRRKDKDEEEA